MEANDLTERTNPQTIIIRTYASTDVMRANPTTDVLRANPTTDEMLSPLLSLPSAIASIEPTPISRSRADATTGCRLGQRLESTPRQ